MDHILYYRDWTTHYFKGRFLNPVYLYEVLCKAVCSISNRQCHHLASGRVDLLYHSLEKGGGGRKKRGMTKQDKFTQRSSALCAVSPLTIEQGAKGREMSAWGEAEILSDQRLAIIVAFAQQSPFVSTPLSSNPPCLPASLHITTPSPSIQPLVLPNTIHTIHTYAQCPKEAGNPPGRGIAMGMVVLHVVGLV